MKTMVDILTERREAIRADLENLTASDREMTPAEVRTFDRGMADMRSLDERIVEARATEAQRRAVDAITPVPAPVHEPRIGVGYEPMTYRASSHQSHLRPEERVSFIRDVIAHQVHRDPVAGERLARHETEARALHSDTERRDVGTAAFSGLTVPQYLTALAATLPRASRPTCDAVLALPLPDQGMTVNISRVTTGSTAAVQPTQNATVSETDIDDTNLVVDVRTIAGSQDVSLQAIMRGSITEELVFSDLAADYARELDSQVLNGSGSAGQHLGIRSTAGIGALTYTDSTPTAGETFAVIASAASTIATSRFESPDTILLHPRRWFFLCSQRDTTGRPVIAAEANGQNVLGTATGAGQGIVGSLMGLRVIADPNLPTTIGGDQDCIVVMRASDQILMEDRTGAPMRLRAEQPLVQNLTVRLVVAGFSAFTAGRLPSSVAVITGTGLAAPTFA
jgi:HK97 family phage major capsid protein